MAKTATATKSVCATKGAKAAVGTKAVVQANAVTVAKAGKGAGKAPMKGPAKAGKGPVKVPKPAKQGLSAPAEVKQGGAKRGAGKMNGDAGEIDSFLKETIWKLEQRADKAEARADKAEHWAENQIEEIKERAGNAEHWADRLEEQRTEALKELSRAEKAVGAAEGHNAALQHDMPKFVNETLDKLFRHLQFAGNRDATNIGLMPRQVKQECIADLDAEPLVAITAEFSPASSKFRKGSRMPSPQDIKDLLDFSVY